MHVINHQGEQLLQAFQQGFSIDEICSYFEKDASPDECHQRLARLWQQWQEINLIDVNQATTQQLPYQLLIRPGLEVIEIVTNSLPLFDYFRRFYQPASAAEDPNLLSTITVQQSKARDFYEIIVGGKKKHPTNELEGAILATCFEIGEESTHEEPRLFIAHAAALTQEKNTWMLPAQAGSGKSTLTAILLKHGY